MNSKSKSALAVSRHALNSSLLRPRKKSRAFASTSARCSMVQIQPLRKRFSFMPCRLCALGSVPDRPAQPGSRQSAWASSSLFVSALVRCHVQNAQARNASKESIVVVQCMCRLLEKAFQFNFRKGVRIGRMLRLLSAVLDADLVMSVVPLLNSPVQQVRGQLR